MLIVGFYLSVLIRSLITKTKNGGIAQRAQQKLGLLSPPGGGVAVFEPVGLCKGTNAVLVAAGTNIFRLIAVLCN